MRAKLVNENIKHLTPRDSYEVDKNINDELKSLGFDNIDVSKLYYNAAGEKIKITQVFTEGVGFSYHVCVEYEILTGKNKGEKTWCDLDFFILIFSEVK